MNEICFRQARREDVPLVMRFIMAHAEYERMSDEVFADECTLEEWIFDKGMAEVIFAQANARKRGLCFSFTAFRPFFAERAYTSLGANPPDD